jgi:hypothetical protein
MKKLTKFERALLDPYYQTHEGKKDLRHIKRVAKKYLLTHSTKTAKAWKKGLTG